MWLRYFFRKNLANCRIMIYEYDSKLTKRGFGGIEDYAREFLEDLKEIRREKIDSYSLNKASLFLTKHYAGF